ncbi:alpha/beta hydrolase [Brochothrix campestris]|uniref:alpha/beta hydrolase n=2 Tax=Brochothrix campestris TaxID=2757 RepID=UPI0038D06E06
MKKHTGLFVILSACLAVGLVITLLSLMQPKYPKAQSTHIPTVFIHGYNGNERTFGGMINRFQSQFDWASNTQTLRVDTDGTVNAVGTFDKDSLNPLINVTFASNKENLKTQAGYIKNIMTYLAEENHIKKVNFVTHSMGGSALTVFIALNHQNAELPQLNKLVYLGVPLAANDYTNKVKSQEKATAKMSQLMAENLPKSTALLIVAGYTSQAVGGDGSVSLESALLAEEIFKKSPIQTQIIKGEAGLHSLLHENSTVDCRIGQFLWSVPQTKLKN